jgi:hypothetical protein
MALQKEIWINSIVEGLFAENSFAARSVDHSGFVNNITVHVPNAGAAPGVVKGRAAFPAAVSSRTDVDLTYGIEEYTTDPVRISKAEEVELSYNKRESVLGGVKQALADVVYGDLIYRWIPASGTIVATSGESTAAHIEGATGSRLSLTKGDVLKLATQFDRWNVPQTGRVLLVDAVMYNQLLGNLSETEAAAFLASVNAQTGVIGKLYGFDILMRSTVAKSTAAGVSKLWTATKAATDSAAAIAWHPTTVSRALGQTELFESENDPLYYGYILSALVRTGGQYIRSDKKGVVLLYQGTPAS